MVLISHLLSLLKRRRQVQAKPLNIRLNILNLEHIKFSMDNKKQVFLSTK